MNKIDGLHHLAICTADMKAQIAFFTDKLGMELVALYWMHGVENTWHGFLRLNDESAIAFVSNPDMKTIPATIGQTHAGMPAPMLRPAPCSMLRSESIAMKHSLLCGTGFGIKGCQLWVPSTMAFAPRFILPDPRT